MMNSQEVMYTERDVNLDNQSLKKKMVRQIIKTREQYECKAEKGSRES